MLFYQRLQLALRHHRVGKVKTVEFYLSWTVSCGVFVEVHQLVNKLVVEWTVRHKFQCTDRVCHALEVVALSVCEVVHGVCVPLGTCAVVGRLYYSVDDGVAEVHVGVRHIQFGTKHHAALNGLGGVHLLEESQIFFYRTVTVWRRCSGLCRSAFLLGNLLRCLFIDVSLSLFYHPYSEVPQTLEVVRSVVQVSPLESQPLYVLQYRVNVLRIFL